MGKDCEKHNENVYFQCRKRQAVNNENLVSRERAAELIGISASTLSDYELGVTKVVPPDKVDVMADVYCCPELRNYYCKNECPIGKHMVLATEVSSLEGIALRLLRELDIDTITDLEKNLIRISSDGVVDKSEEDMLEMILKRLDDVMFAISELKLIGERVLKDR